MIDVKLDKQTSQRMFRPISFSFFLLFVIFIIVYPYIFQSVFSSRVVLIIFLIFLFGSSVISALSKYTLSFESDGLMLQNTAIGFLSKKISFENIVEIVLTDKQFDSMRFVFNKNKAQKYDASRPTGMIVKLKKGGMLIMRFTELETIDSFFTQLQSYGIVVSNQADIEINQ